MGAGVDEKTVWNIFTYFVHPLTNAYTQSRNNLIIRVVNHVGRGYSFEALRANTVHRGLPEGQ